MHAKAAAQVINCWQTAADPQQPFRKSHLRATKLGTDISLIEDESHI